MRYVDATELYKKVGSWGMSAELWKNHQLQTDFRACFFNKCWYTETFLDGADKPIDHFRPKGKITPYEDFEYNRPIKDSGYDWLKNDYRNYRCCCTYANRRTDEGGKSCFFPLMSNVYLTSAGTEAEEPALLDPLKKDDVNLIYFDKAHILPVKRDEITEKRVSASKNIYNLMHFDFKPRRIKIWEEVERTLERFKVGKIQEDICLEYLSEMISKDALHSACAISAVISLAPDSIKRKLDLEL